MSPIRRLLAAFAFAFAIAIALATLAPAALRAQSVEGRLTEQGNDRAVPGAVVFLWSEARDWSASALSDADGRFRVEARGPGRYFLQVERIGFPTVATEPFALAPGEALGYALALPAAPVTLEAIRVEGERRCEGDPRRGADLERVWEEARKALFLTTRTAEVAALEYEYATFERVLDREGERTWDEKLEYRTLRGGLPFASIPADSLAAYGYLRPSPPNVTFYAPDAHVLLSESFLEGHCFGLVEGRGGRRGMIGLAFEPVPEQRRPDVEGVLWIDRKTSELRDLEFGYRNVRAWDRSSMGGHVQFVRLPTGDWIVHHWRLRWPITDIRFGTEPQDTRFGRTLNVKEVGGTVVDIRPAAPAATSGEGG